MPETPGGALREEEPPEGMSADISVAEVVVVAVVAEIGIARMSTGCNAISAMVPSFGALPWVSHDVADG